MPQHIEKLLKKLGCLILVVWLVIVALQVAWSWWERESENALVRRTLDEFIHDRPEAATWFELHELELDVDHIVTVSGLTNRLKHAYIPLRPRGAGPSYGPAAVVLETEDPAMLGWIALLDSKGRGDVTSIANAAVALVGLEQTKSVSGVLRQRPIRSLDEVRALHKIREWVTSDCVFIAHQKRPSMGFAFCVLIGGALLVGLIVVVSRAQRWKPGDKAASVARPPPLEGAGGSGVSGGR